MELTVQTFDSFEKADAADIAYYRSLTPEQRMDILLELVKQGSPGHESEQRLERVYRIVDLAQS